MKTVDMSGFGGSYEFTMQKMLENGERFLAANPGAVGKWKAWENVTGIMLSEDDDAKRLETAVMDGINDATGAMHQAVIMHLIFIARNGRDKWLSEFPEDRKFDFNGTVSSCPKTELSEKMAMEALGDA
jgi:hypothetical protein